MSLEPSVIYEVVFRNGHRFVSKDQGAIAPVHGVVRFRGRRWAEGKAPWQERDTLAVTRDDQLPWVTAAAPNIDYVLTHKVVRRSTQ